MMNIICNGVYTSFQNMIFPYFSEQLYYNQIFS